MGATRKRILPEEEKQMWLWIYKNLKEGNKDAYSSCGFQIWNQYIHHYGIKDRTADSYTTRFRKYMKPAIIKSQLKPSQIDFIIKKCNWNVVPSQQKLLQKMLEDEKAFENGNISGYVDESTISLPAKEETDDSIVGCQNTPTTSKGLEKCAVVVVKKGPSSTRPSRRLISPLQNYNDKLRSCAAVVSTAGPDVIDITLVNSPGRFLENVSPRLEPNKSRKSSDDIKDGNDSDSLKPRSSNRKTIVGTSDEESGEENVVKKGPSSTRPSRRSNNPFQNYNEELLYRRSRDAVISTEPYITPLAYIFNNVVIKEEDGIKEQLKKSQKRRAHSPNKSVKKRIISDENGTPKPIAVELKQEILTETAENNIVEKESIPLATKKLDENMISSSEQQILAGGWDATDDENLKSTTPSYISVNENEQDLPYPKIPEPASLEKENLAVISNGVTVVEENILPVTKESISLNENMGSSAADKSKNIIPNVSEPQNAGTGWNPVDDEDLKKLISNIFGKEKQLDFEAPKTVEVVEQHKRSTKVTNNIVKKVFSITKETLSTNENIIVSASETQNIAGCCYANDDENLTPELTSNVSSNVVNENLPYPEAPQSIFGSLADTSKKSNMQSSDIEMFESIDTSLNDKVESHTTAGTSERILTEHSFINDKATPIKISAQITRNKNVTVFTPKSVFYSGQQKSKGDGIEMRIRFQSPEKPSKTNNLTAKRTGVNTPEFSDIDNEILQLLWHNVHGDNVNDLSPTDLAAFQKIALFKDLHMRIKNVQSFFRGRKPTP